MTPVIHCSAGNIHFFTRATFIQRKEIQLTKHKNYNRLTSSSQRFLLPQSSLRLFPIYRSGFFSKHGSGIRSIAAVGADVTVEEPNPAVSGKHAVETTKSSTSSVETSESAPTGSNPVLTSAKTKRSRPVRKSEMPPVKDEDLIPGASFTGKVRSVQPFGAFVDFGAFTDGLVHVSRMSDGYVKDVASVVSVGQEVKVRIVEANMETGRISLTMRDSDDARKVQQKRESPATGSSDRPRSARKNAARSTQKRDEEQKKSNFVKGQVLTGTVKNTIRSGSFVSLPDGEEGFIPVSEESEGFGNVTGNSSLQVGQEVNVRVLRIARGKVTLTMKKEEDVEEINRQLNKGVWHTATNPFELAFRQNKDIASFLDDRERSQKSPKYISLPKNSEEVEDKVDDTITKSDTLIEDGSTTMEELLEATTSAESSSTELVSGDEEPVNLPWSFNAVPETLSEDSDSSRTLTKSSSDSDLAEVPVVNDEQDSSAAVDTSLAKDADSVVDEGKEQDTGTKTVEAIEDDSLKAPVVDEVIVTDEVTENDVANAIVSEDEASTETLNSLENNDSADPVTVEDSAGEIGDGILSSQVEVRVEADDSQGDTTLVEEKLDTETPAEVENAVTDAVEEIVSNAIVSDDEASTETLDFQENSDSADIQTVSTGEIGDGILTSQGEVPEEAENTQGNATLVEENLETEMPAEIKNVVTDGVKENDIANAIVSEDDTSTATLNSQVNTDPADPITVSAGEVGEEISTSQVEVPDDTQGDAALLEEKLEIEAPVEIENVIADGVKENDVANAIISEDEASTETLNSQENSDSADCVTVSAGELDDGILTSQVAVPDEADDTQGNAALLEEKLETEAHVEIENVVTDGVKENDVVNAIISEDEASTETLNSQEYSDSADHATVSAGEIDDGILTSQVEVPVEADDTQGDATLVDERLETETPAQVENVVASADPKNAKLMTPDALNGQTGSLEEASTLKATISPALVKQLREETGAGMMDCKKALSETGGDIVKAQEFLRKKGLASADKKASRTTAEGRIGSYVHDGRIGVLIEVNCETDFVSRGEIFNQLVEDLAMQVAACPQVHYLVTEDVPKEIVDKEREIEMQKEDLLSKPENIRSKIVDGRIRKRLEQFALLEQPYIKNDKMVVKDWVKQTIATIGENIKVSRFVRYNLGEGLEKKSQDFAAEVAAQTAAKESPAAPKESPVETKETVEKPPAIAVSAALVKQLREETGAGMMDCKKALTETGGNLEKAQEYLRKKGLSSADKKSSRLAAEGRISAYVHDSRIGCLIEVNSETDFVARNEKFKELVDDLAMQVVACPQVEFVSVEDIPEDIVNKEKEIEMQREDLKSKPENIREKIVEGRISKRLGELALLEQPFIRNDKVTVKDLVKQTVAALGENIRVRRFVRFTLGETKVDS